jgi:membrane protein YqaA with SNARE-associated domain
VLAGILALGSGAAGLAVAVVTAGNTLGSGVNWGIGRFLAGCRDHAKLARYLAVPGG